MVNMINNALQPTASRQISALPQTAINENPFAASPFVTVQSKKNAFYGKNNPVFGGYFAGYRDGKPNIVGRKLFIEV